MTRDKNSALSSRRCARALLSTCSSSAAVPPGLASAVSADRAGARVALATKTTLQACNSAKAQGGIQAAFGEDDSPEIHAEDVMRSSHDTANPALVEVLTSEAPSAIHWLEEAGVEFTTVERRLSARALRRRDAAAPASGRRPHRARDHEGASREVRVGLRRPSCPTTGCVELEPSDAGWVASFDAKEGTRRGRCQAPLSSPPAVAASRWPRPAASCPRTTRTRRARRRAIATDAGAEVRDLDALQYHPNGGAWPSTMQGYSIPETTRAYGAVLRNADGEEFTDSLGPRDAVSAGDRRRGREGQGRCDARRATGRLARHDHDRARGRRDLAPLHAPALSRRWHRPARGADLHVSRPPLPERWARDRRARGDDARGRLRLRRDRGRHPRKESHDGQLAPRVRRLRASRRSRPQRRGARA